MLCGDGTRFNVLNARHGTIADDERMRVKLYPCSTKLPWLSSDKRISVAKLITNDAALYINLERTNSYISFYYKVQGNAVGQESHPEKKILPGINFDSDTILLIRVRKIKSHMVVRCLIWIA
jgi:hypothetical protein